MKTIFRKVLLLTILVHELTYPPPAPAQDVKIRVGHFPNVTHAPALIARATKHFEKSFEKNVTIEWKTFNAGPLAMEALFAREIDLLYVGPNPAINGYVRSKGEALRVIAGVASGGSAFVVRSGSKIQKPEDIKGKRVATPQIGNSQDVAFRYFMLEKGLSPRSKGGDVDIFNVVSGDQLTVLSQTQVDAIWTTEPWVSRLISEANGKILFEEKELWPNGEYATALLVVRKAFMEQHVSLVQSWVKGHVELTNWMKNHPQEAKQLFNDELKREIGKALPKIYLNKSFEQIKFTYNPMKSSVEELAQRAFAIGFLGKGKVNLSNLYELSFLNQVENKP